MGRNRRKRYNRPGAGKRGPGPHERDRRQLPDPTAKPDPGQTIFVTAEKPREFLQDANLAVEVCGARQRGLPAELARTVYEVADRLIRNEELESGGLSNIAKALANIAKVDIETGRYQAGEPAGTININQQRTETPEELAKAYAEVIKRQVEAAYESGQNGHASPTDS